MRDRTTAMLAVIVTAGTLLSDHGTSPVRAADEDAAPALFQELFGEDVRRARSTPSPDDDLRLAEYLLTSARSSQNQPALFAEVCRTAYELAAPHPEGWELAVRAMRALEWQPPRSERLDRLAAIVMIRSQQYGAARGDKKGPVGEHLIRVLLQHGDELAAAGREDEHDRALQRAAQVAIAIQSPWRTVVGARRAHLKLAAAHRAREARHRQEIRKRLAALETAPDAEEAQRNMYLLHLIELDDPAGAARFARGSDEVAMQRLIYASGALRPPDEMMWLKLAEWYQARSVDAESQTGRGHMLARMVRYCRRFLDGHPQEDIYRAKASFLMEQTRPVVERMGIVGADGRWFELGPFVDVAKDSIYGLWTRTGRQLVSPAGPLSRVVVPVVPEGDYELRFDIDHPPGAGRVYAVLPVGESAVMLRLGGPDPRHALMDVRGRVRDADYGGSLDGRHTVHVRVMTDDEGNAPSARVVVRMDRLTLFDWTGDPADLAVPPQAWTPQPRAITLGADSEGVGFGPIEARMIEGRAWLPRVVPTAPGGLDGPDQPPASVRNPWVDLLDRVRPAQHIVRGLREEWTKDADGLSVRRRDKARITLPVAPLGDYVLQVEFSCVSHCEGVHIVLPVGDRTALLTLNGWLGYLSGLEAIDGRRVNDDRNPTQMKVRPLDRRKRYVLEVTVRHADGRATVEATLDDEPYLTWSGDVSRLSLPDEFAMPYTDALGLGANETRMVFHVARVKMLGDGKVRELQ